MGLFIVLVVAVFAFQVICQKMNDSKKKYVFIMFFIFGIMMMFRAKFVGNDTDEYLRFYRSVGRTDNLKSFIEHTRFEKGFVYLCYILNKISDDSQFLLISTGAFIAYSFGRFINKYSDIPWMSVLMFLSLQFFDLAMSGVRQILAIAVLLFAYDFLIKRKFFRFLLLVLIATYFHTSAFLFLLLYPFATKHRTKKFYIISMIVGVFTLLSFDRVIGMIEKVLPQYIHYLTQDSGSYSVGPKLAVILQFALWFIIFIFSKMYSQKEKETPLDRSLAARTVIENKKIFADSVHELAVWFGVIALALSLQGTILTRFKYVFSTPIILYFPNMLANIEDQKERDLVTYVAGAVFVAYSAVIYIFRPMWQSTYPFYFFWQNII